MISEEVWKDIKDYEGFYQVSNLGNVRTKDRYISNGNGIQFKKSKMLKPIKMKNGYLKVSLSKNGKVKQTYIHRLVAQSFLPNKNNYDCINHKDENKVNNIVSNLEWCNHTYNNRYSDILSRPRKKVSQYDINGNYIKTYKSVCDAQRETKIPQGEISRVARKERKQCHGYVWIYE